MRYELIKVLGNRIIIIAIVLATLFSGLYSYNVYIKGKLDENNMTYASKTKYKSYQGSYSDEKYEDLFEKVTQLELKYEQNEDKQLFEEMFEFHLLFSRAQNCKNVIEYRQTVRDNAKRLMESEDGYYYKLNKLIYDKYKITPDLYIETGTTLNDIATMFNVSEILDVAFVFILVLIACNIFLIEHSSGTFYMIKATCKGWKQVYIKKILCMICLTTIITSLQVTSMVFLTSIKGNANEWKDLILQCEYFENSPYNFSVIELVLVVFLLKLIGYLTLISSFVCISLFFKKNMIPLILCIVIGEGGQVLNYIMCGKYFVLAGGKSTPMEKYILLKKYSVFPSINEPVEYLNKFETTNIVGTPVSVLVINIISSLFFTMLFITLGYQIYKYNFRKAGV